MIPHFFLILGLATPALACIQTSIAGQDLVSGKSLALAPEAGKPVVAVFLSTLCPCSQSHEPSLRVLAEEFPAFKWVGIHSNVSESVARGKEHFEKAQLGFPVVRDEGAKLANSLGALRTPHVFVIGEGGRCLYKGGVDASHTAQPLETSFLRRALLSVRAGRGPSPKETRVLGCAIDR